MGCSHASEIIPFNFETYGPDSKDVLAEGVEKEEVLGDERIEDVVEPWPSKR